MVKVTFIMRWFLYFPDKKGMSLYVFELTFCDTPFLILIGKPITVKKKFDASLKDGKWVFIF